jgi:hypothetical protein
MREGTTSTSCSPARHSSYVFGRTSPDKDSAGPGGDLPVASGPPQSRARLPERDRLSEPQGWVQVANRVIELDNRNGSSSVA